MNIAKQKMKVWRMAFKAAIASGHVFIDAVTFANGAVDEFVKTFNLQPVENKEVLNG